MGKLSVLLLGCKALEAGEMPFRIEECLECLDLVDKFSLDLRKDFETDFSEDACLNRLIIRTDAIAVTDEKMRHLADLEYEYFGGGDAGKVISTLLQYKITGRDAALPLGKLADSKEFRKYAAYWAEITSMPTFYEVFGAWKENPDVLSYVSSEVRWKFLQECNGIFRRFRLELLSAVTIRWLVNDVFVSFGLGSTKECVLAKIKETMELFNRHGVQLNDIQYAEWAVIQCYGGDIYAEGN